MGHSHGKMPKYQVSPVPNTRPEAGHGVMLGGTGWALEIGVDGDTNGCPRATADMVAGNDFDRGIGRALAE